ncbi:centrosomal protein of 72 kDa-like [Dysidea avara]|uniref:centrosomal protein of 72 kDa-like n=1 Tax=Dysidea avara TaxID=196820 RepID=UPI0033336F30
MAGNLVITEKWIRDRLNLTIDTLEDVRSLALPGSYHEKITHLGRSLASFTRLKHLDLARNAISSLEGLEHLQLLETLNLYYNNIPDLKELYKLRHNLNLKELDLRLNPVTKNEPDYRLFLIHMLVKLRVLDDRPVRDGERKAALMHFDSSQAAELNKAQETNSEMFNAEREHIAKHIQSRKDLVNSLARPPVHIGSDETDQLLDLIAENEEKLVPGRVHDSSSEKKRKRELKQHQHSTPRAVIAAPSRSPANRFPTKSPTITATPHKQQSSTLETAVHFSKSAPTVVATHSGLHNLAHHGGRSLSPPVQFGNDDEVRLKELFNILKSKDIEHWESDAALQSMLVQWMRRHQSGRRAVAMEEEHVVGEMAAMRSKLQQKDIELREVAERLKEREMEAIVLGQKLHLQTEELTQLQQKSQMEITSAEMLQRAHADLSTLNEHVRNLEKENSLLRTQLSQQRKSVSPVDPHLIDRLQSENSLLKGEIDSLTQQNKQQLQGLNQVQELATMLQESHRSLVATNDHLLRELDETKRRHKLDIQQAHSNYEQLRQTVDLIQDT